jgi:hypothetical protein
LTFLPTLSATIFRLFQCSVTVHFKAHECLHRYYCSNFQEWDVDCENTKMIAAIFFGWPPISGFFHDAKLINMFISWCTTTEKKHFPPFSISSSGSPELNKLQFKKIFLSTNESWFFRKIYKQRYNVYCSKIEF